MKKNIVFFHLFNNFSGSPKVLSDVISSIQDNYDITLVTSNSDGFLSNLSIKTKYFPYTWTPNKMLLLFRFLRAQIYMIIYALTFSKRDTIFYINTHQPAIVGLIGKLTGKRVVFHIHETHNSQKYFGKIFLLIRKIVKGDEIFVSEYLRNIEEIKSRRSEVIYNMVSQNIYKYAAKSVYSPLKNDIFNVIMICSLKDYKGIPEFLEICSILKDNKNISSQLIVNANKKEIDYYFKEYHIGNNLEIIPSTKTPEHFFNSASLLLCLSRIDEWTETFGLTILEAMTFGIPCIVPPIGGPTELVDHNINGYHIAGYDKEKIAKTIFDLSQNPNICIDLSNKAKEKSINFSPIIFEKKILRFINNIW